MWRTAGVALVGALTCLLAGCSSAAPNVARPQVDPVPPTVCERPAGIEGRVRAFLAAYDGGEHGLADRFFAPAGRFRWYSEPGLRQGPAAYERTTLDAYLARRQRAGDRLELASLRRSGDGGDFAFTVRRGVQALPSKGALDCRSGLFVVWSLGPNPGP